MPVITDARNVARFVWSHPANDGERVRALLRAARFQARGRVLRRRTLARIGERSWIWADLHRTGASKVVYANPPDHPEMMVWRQHLRAGDLFVDCRCEHRQLCSLGGRIGCGRHRAGAGQ